MDSEVKSSILRQPKQRDYKIWPEIGNWLVGDPHSLHLLNRKAVSCLRTESAQDERLEATVPQGPGRGAATPHREVRCLYAAQGGALLHHEAQEPS